MLNCMKGFQRLDRNFQIFIYGKNIALAVCEWFLVTRLFQLPHFLLEYS